MLRRLFLGLLGLFPFGFLPYHLRMPTSRRERKKYYVDIEGQNPILLAESEDGNRQIYQTWKDGQWVITRIEC